jgi:hypothetical protein
MFNPYLFYTVLIPCPWLRNQGSFQLGNLTSQGLGRNSQTLNFCVSLFSHPEIEFGHNVYTAEAFGNFSRQVYSQYYMQRNFFYFDILENVAVWRNWQILILVSITDLYHTQFMESLRMEKKHVLDSICRLIKINLTFKCRNEIVNVL